jgi:solute carrier family 36 (proton-coupled amino acid transporter)
VLAQAFLAITLTYVFFGVFGYLAYGDETKDIITLNLPNNWSSAAVKVGYTFCYNSQI